MSIENGIHQEYETAMPTFEAAVHDIATLYLERATDPDHEDDLAYLSEKTLEIDEAWRQEGFEGVTAFLCKDGQYLAIGRRLHEDERQDYAAAWAADSYPLLVDFDMQQREQTLRVMYGGEVRDVVIPPEFQAHGMHYNGFDGVDGITYLFRVGNRTPGVYRGRYSRYDEPHLSEDMTWLRGLLGNSASINYGDDRFRCLEVQTYDLPDHGHTLPALEDVVAAYDAMRAEQPELV